MALIHDLSESIVGDLVLDEYVRTADLETVSKKEKRER